MKRKVQFVQDEDEVRKEKMKRMWLIMRNDKPVFINRNDYVMHRREENITRIREEEEKLKKQANNEKTRKQHEANLIPMIVRLLIDNPGVDNIQFGGVENTNNDDVLTVRDPFIIPRMCNIPLTSEIFYQKLEEIKKELEEDGFTVKISDYQYRGLYTTFVLKFIFQY